MSGSMNELVSLMG